MTPSNPWAVVLGASSGFGAAIAPALAAVGHGVLGVHLDLRAGQARADAVRDAVLAHGAPAAFYNGNAADEAHRDRALDLLPPDADVRVLVHSLAFGSLRPMIGPPSERLGPKHFDTTLAVMAHSLVSWTQGLRDRGHLRSGSHVFALTSSGSLVVLPDYGAVSAAKAALESHVRQLAVELAPEGVAVNAIMAGLCRTPALARIPQHEALAAEAEARNPSGRLTTPDDVAGAIVALLDPRLRWMTGNTLRIDGGETIAAAPRRPPAP